MFCVIQNSHVLGKNVFLGLKIIYSISKIFVKLWIIYRNSKLKMFSFYRLQLGTCEQREKETLSKLTYSYRIRYDRKWKSIEIR